MLRLAFNFVLEIDSKIIMACFQEAVHHMLYQLSNLVLRVLRLFDQRFVARRDSNSTFSPDDQSLRTLLSKLSTVMRMLGKMSP